MNSAPPFNTAGGVRNIKLSPSFSSSTQSCSHHQHPSAHHRKRSRSFYPCSRRDGCSFPYLHKSIRLADVGLVNGHLLPWPGSFASYASSVLLRRWRQELQPWVGRDVRRKGYIAYTAMITRALSAPRCLFDDFMVSRERSILRRSYRHKSVLHFNQLINLQLGVNVLSERIIGSRTDFWFWFEYLHRVGGRSIARSECKSVSVTARMYAL